MKLPRSFWDTKSCFFTRISFSHRLLSISLFLLSAALLACCIVSCSASKRTYVPEKKEKNVLETGSETGSVEYREGGAGVGGVPGAIIAETESDHQGKIELQKEILIRQEEELKRLDREMEDLRRQEYYNQLMKRYDQQDQQ